MSEGSLQDFKDFVSKEANDMTAAEAWAKGLCVHCHKPPTFYSDEGKAEYKISGLCEPCFDEACAEPPMLSPEEFYGFWVQAGGSETPFLHDQAMEFTSAYAALAFGVRAAETELEVKIEEAMEKGEVA
jgi:hypothetical protein